MHLVSFTLSVHLNVSGLDPRYDYASSSVLKDRIVREFIGAVLCESVTIEKYILEGTFGRGWLGMYSARRVRS